MPPGDKSRSNSQIDASSWQILYEFERRLDEKLTEARRQTKEDIKNALEPINARLAAIEKRLDDGQRKFEDMDKRLSAAVSRADDQSDRIDNIPELLRQHTASCPVITQNRQTTTATIKKQKSTMPWWLPLLLGGALAFVGEKAARFVINGLADPPQVQAPTPVSPQQPALPGTPAVNISLGQTKQ